MFLTYCKLSEYLSNNAQNFKASQRSPSHSIYSVPGPPVSEVFQPKPWVRRFRASAGFRRFAMFSFVPQGSRRPRHGQRRLREPNGRRGICGRNSNRPSLDRTITVFKFRFLVQVALFLAGCYHSNNHTWFSDFMIGEKNSFSSRTSYLAQLKRFVQFFPSDRQARNIPASGSLIDERMFCVLCVPPPPLRCLAPTRRPPNPMFF